MSWILLSFVLMLLTLAFPRLVGCLVTVAIMFAVFFGFISYYLVGGLPSGLGPTGAAVIGAVAALVAGAASYDFLVRRRS